MTAQLSECDVKMVKRGCFRDPWAQSWNRNNRPLNTMLHNFKNINWGSGWDDFLHKTACE